MFSFFRDLARGSRAPKTVIVLDEGGVSEPRQYRIAPRHLIGLYATSSLSVGVLLTLLVMLTPIRQIFLGPDPETLRERVEINAMRAAALADSLELQREYMAVIRGMLAGWPDSMFAYSGSAFDLEDVEPADPLERPVRERTANWEDHAPPALSFARLDASPRPAPLSEAADAFISGLLFPALPPVEGFFARGYDATIGHFGIDIAVEEDTPVRSIGDGYVVFADWTNDGGFVIAIQHGDGFLSVYKHNNRLLKRVGDRVRAREAIALSGNTGEVTTGPHLHFELWRNGFAQDPRAYLVGQ